jgi:hypothetical protein
MKRLRAEAPDNPAMVDPSIERVRAVPNAGYRQQRRCAPLSSNRSCFMSAVRIYYVWPG